MDEKTYEVTWRRNKSNQNPTDEFPVGVATVDFRLVKMTSRREVWRYVIESSYTYMFEAGLDRADSCLGYKQVDE